MEPLTSRALWPAFWTAAGVPPQFFVTAHSKGLADGYFGTADSKELTDGQLRPKPGKTRCSLVSAHSKGLAEVDLWRAAGKEGGTYTPRHFGSLSKQEGC